MKHFIVKVMYKVSLKRINEVIAKHREYLQIGYDRGLLLCSGPQEPWIGGLVVARAESVDNLKEFFKNDPYQLQGLADYTYQEFIPVKYQPFMKEWIS